MPVAQAKAKAPRFDGAFCFSGKVFLKDALQAYSGAAAVAPAPAPASRTIS